MIGNNSDCASHICQTIDNLKGYMANSGQTIDNLPCVWEDTIEDMDLVGVDSDWRR